MTEYAILSMQWFNKFIFCFFATVGKKSASAPLSLNTHFKDKSCQIMKKTYFQKYLLQILCLKTQNETNTCLVQTSKMEGKKVE